MTNTIEAVYEGGVFRPVRKIDLTDGTHVEVIIPSTASPRDPKAAAARLAEIAAEARRTGPPDSASRDHDESLCC
jgi:predicted DNA-binding antitoxin AbrB/MazE fold protein